MHARQILRVGFDGHAFSSPAAGIRRYSAELVRALVALGEPMEVVALGGDAGCIPPGVERVADASHPPSNAGWTLIGLPRTAARARVHVIHAPAYTAPFWAPVPVVLTIHDVSYEIHPEWYPYRRDWLRRYFYRRSAQSAARVLTVSSFSASEITVAYGIPPSRCIVVGDTEHDIRCARFAGARVVAVATGTRRREELAAYQPDLLLDDLAEFNDLLAWARRIAAGE